jgi:SAM-dependent methyltransferase
VLVDFADSVLAVEDLPSGPPTATEAAGPTAALRKLVRPTNRVAAGNIDRLLALLAPGSTLLVVGGASIGNGADAVYRSPDVDVLSFDIAPSEHTQFVADAHRIPLGDASVDAVVVQAVLEHVLDPWQVVQEIHRVLVPEGVVYAETPFMQQVHAGRYDFTRFTDSGHRWLFRRFTEIDRGVVAGPGTTLSWSLDHWARGVTGSRAVGRAVRLLLFWVRFADRVARADAATDGASALYFLGRRSTHTLAPRDVITGYAGAQHGRARRRRRLRTPPDPPVAERRALGRRQRAAR